MTKKKDSLTIDTDLSDLFNRERLTDAPRNNSDNVGISILQALDIVIKQMEASGMRTRTITDYETHVKHFVKITEIEALADVSSDSIYLWLSSMNVANSTKLIRLKCLRAFLERCLTNGWLSNPFWREIKIKVHTPIKEGAAEKDVMFLLSMLDLTDFVQLRDATAILTLYQTGIRVETAAKLRTSHVDLKSKCLRIGGDIIKNYEAIILPFDDRLARLFEVLIAQNEKIRQEQNVKNDYIFITQHGQNCQRTPTNNNISKRINKYRREFGLKNMSPHALRRGFAINLYKRSGRDLALVSKALGHSDFSVTTRYLHLTAEEVAEDIRKHL